MITQEFLGKICDIKTGKLDVNAESPDGKYPFFTCAETPVKIDFYDYDCECVLIAGNGELAVNYYKGKFNAYQRTYIVTAKDKFKDETYLPYLYPILKRAILDLKSQSQGSIIQYLRLPQLEALEIPFPKPDEQKRIAAILDKADRLRRQRRFAQTLSDSFLQSVFIKMFGDPMSNPMNWDKATLDSQLKNIDSGVSPVCEEFSRKKNEWAVLKLSSVTSGRFLPDENKVLPSNIKPVLNYEVKESDVLFTRKNTEDLIAACALVYDTPQKLLLPDTIFRFKLKDNCDVKAEFLWGLFNERKFRRTVQSFATGSAGSMPNISKEKLNSLQILTPPLPLQKKFAAIVQKFERVRRQQREATRQAEHLFQTLLHRAFRGEL
ncbi:MAG TPA: restriction endonuclease subunit S [Pyrinomonadaceae bacterium]|jgi:type I restriction enzyme S subunit|nr:restriction endonuclease subunit S [Pyrinomonadaceae bacterium]